MPAIKYCDLKTAKNGSEYKVVTFDDGSPKVTAYKKDQAGNACSFWDALYVGAEGTYTTIQQGQFTNLQSFTPSAGSPSAGPASSAPTNNRERLIQMQTCIKAASIVGQGLVIAKHATEENVVGKVWGIAEQLYERLTGDQFNDPFADD